LRLSVVVPTYNRSEVLRVCLASLARQTLSSDQFEVLVVDDGSTDDTESVVGSFRGALPVRYLRQPQNRGRAAARNRGIREASGDVVVFVDSDVFPVPGFLAAHRSVHLASPRAVGRGPLLLTSHLDDPFGKPPLLPDPSPAFLDTANASVRREHLLAAGGFDEEFRHYGWEDADLGLRLRRMGLRRVYDRRALAYHYQPPATPESVPELLQKEEERARMAVRFLRKRFDESFSGYGWEDIELGVRLRHSGVRIHWEPRAVTWHYHVEDLEGARRKLVEAGRGAVYFWNKYRRPLGLGLFLELHPTLLPLKWLVYRSGVLTPWIRRILHRAERHLSSAQGLSRKLWLAVANECYAHLLWHAYYEGVEQALREGLDGCAS
jgi:GT2 family glycosyltransferase